MKKKNVTGQKMSDFMFFPLKSHSHIFIFIQEISHRRFRIHEYSYDFYSLVFDCAAFWSSNFCNSSIRILHSSPGLHTPQRRNSEESSHLPYSPFYIDRVNGLSIRQKKGLKKNTS